MSIDPELAAVLLALAVGSGVTLAARRRRTCPTCGRRVGNPLCACDRLGAELHDVWVCAVHGRPACTQCGPPQDRS